MKLLKDNSSYLLIISTLVVLYFSFSCSNLRNTATNKNSIDKSQFYLINDKSDNKCKYQIVEIDFWGEEIFYENRVYNLISSKQIKSNHFEGNENLFDFFCFSNDTAYLLNARKDTLNNTYKAFKNNIFFILNDSTIRNYYSMNLFGCESKLKSKYYDANIGDTVFDYSIGAYITGASHISNIKVSRKLGVFSLIYYNQVFGCEYQRIILKSESNYYDDKKNSR